MILENKYNVPRETWKQLCKDGIVSSHVMRNYEIYDMFNKKKAENPARSNSNIFDDIAEELRVSKALVDKVVYEFRKTGM